MTNRHCGTCTRGPARARHADRHPWGPAKRVPYNV